uniref:Gasdermin PUB domain-containing protein n=1 Tax=Ursus maritimus TaxID=29073 RepID=A0A452VC00_URSMA
MPSPHTHTHTHTHTLTLSLSLRHSHMPTHTLTHTLLSVVSSLQHLVSAHFPHKVWNHPGREQDWEQKQHLHEEIFQEVEALAQLSKDAQDAIFHNILNMLGNREALQDLVDELDGNPWDSLDGFGGKILNEMQEDIRDVWIQERFHMIYLLEAIMVLSNAQHDLLTQSMKKRTLLQQRELVKSILEPNFKCSGNIPFTLKPELLAPLQDEDLAITYGLLQECGLNMELNSPRSTWDQEAKQPLSALYGTLSVLQQLAVTNRWWAEPSSTVTTPQDREPDEESLQFGN